ncbi:MAG: S-layer homology domain-containing protein [Clostridia bacterium]|nr:S-layer homology domain-containing protein [Clostridia bacterium]
MIFGKRALSLYCALLILFTAVNTIFAEDVSVQGAVSEEHRRKTEVLNSLGITDVQLNNYSAEAAVTREMFSEGIAAMMCDDVPGAGIEPVGDLDADDTGMLYLMSMGIIDGTEKNVYRPNDNITFEQAAKIAVSALNLDKITGYKGGYPSGYLAEAQRIGLFDGIHASSAELCMSDYINLLYNLLDIDVLKADGFTGGNVSYNRTEGNTLIYVYRNIEKGEGLVSANRYSGLYTAGEATNNDGVVIDGEYYNVGETNAEDSLGSYCEFYFHDSKTDSEKTLLYITPARINKRLFAQSDDLSYDDGVYTYTDEKGKSKTITIPDDAVIMYNGVFQPLPDKSKFVPPYGSVEFISNDGDNSYEVIKIIDITVTNVLSVSSDGTVIYDKYDANNNIDLEEKDYSVTLPNGNEGTVFNINSDNVVETVKIENGRQSYYKIKVVTDSVTVTAQRIESESREVSDETVSVANEIYSEDKMYIVSERLKDLLASGKLVNPAPGRTYVFLLNSRGEIADISDSSEKSFRIGYFKRLTVNEDEEKRIVRLFDESGSWEYYDLAERIKLNGASTEADKINDLDMYIGKVCKYEINVAGEVTSLYFPSETDGNFRTVYSMENPYFRRYYGSPVFGPKSEDDGKTCSIKSTSVIFVIPNIAEDLVNEKSEGFKYAVIPSSKLPNYITYGNVEIYNTEGDIGIGDVAVVKMKTHGYVLNENSTRLVLINDIRTIWDDDEVKTEVVAISNGNEKRFFVEDLRTNKGELPFQPGDLIFCFLSYDRTLRLYDDAKYYHILFDYDDENPVFTKAFNWSAGSTIGISYRSSMAADVRIRYGSVYKMDGEYLWLNTSDNPADISSVEATKYTSAKIYVYDKDTEEYKIGKASDIVGYTADNVNYSKAVVVYCDNYAEIVIY